VVPIPRGTVFHQQAGGGGGYGDPRQRPAETVAAEVRDGLISSDSARRDYGVWVDPEPLALDPERTARLRRGPSEPRA